MAIFANNQLPVFPEAVRSELLERMLAPSGRDLKADSRNGLKIKVVACNVWRFHATKPDCFS
ncbi:MULTISPECIES: hypothetical protein [unclassified Paraburkholderia]|uniref:hypothetical protein n=1 Tax=unclassified Paraburkholderia TaxID=2615204 RepID=UPI000E37EE99|nr:MULTISPECIES: hypothetical protein [unclassified Paraburkholderia]REE24213.1 hypothetical protein B0G71_7518 [Paraburkholderia sp. BL27I4N3]RKR38340.1 hypothetical protein B0G82_6471 [Paraburkholderia sp. BL17N1]